MADFALLYAIIFTIIFTIIFPSIAHGTIIFPIMSDYFTLFFRLFPIMSWCRHPENGNVQTAILDPIMKE